MRIEHQSINEVFTKISLSGRLDQQNSQEIEQNFIALASSKKAGVIVDMLELEFLSSMGLRILITAAKSQAKLGGKLVICSPQPFVKEVMTTVGIDKMIKIYDDYDQALNELQSIDF